MPVPATPHGTLPQWTDLRCDAEASEALKIKESSASRLTASSRRPKVSIQEIRPIFLRLHHSRKTVRRIAGLQQFQEKMMKIGSRCTAVAFYTLAAMLAAGCAQLATAQDNLRDGAPFNGYTGVKFDTTNYAYDYLVDSSLPQDDPAAKKFKTVEAAYAAAPAGTPDHPTVIGIKPDVYRMHVGPDAPYSLQVTKDNITFLGLTDDRRKVVLADNRGNKEGANNNGYIFDVNANGFSMINLSVVDYANLDYEYPGDPSKNLKMRSPVITQAVAIQMQGDRHVYSHVAFLSRLDTTFIRTTRSYFTNVFIEGTDDFLGGGTIGVFNDSQIYFPTGRGVMSASNLTFIHTTFKAARGVEFFKGFGNPDTLIECTMPVLSPTTHVTWMAWDVLPAPEPLCADLPRQGRERKADAHQGQDQGNSDLHALA